MQKSIFDIPKMDCPSEENMIRVKLQGFSEIKKLQFDIPNRKLEVYHLGEINPIDTSLAELNLGSKLLTSENTTQTEFEDETGQRKLLWAVLWINFAFFVIEMTTGIVSESMGLIADSLDMLADSFVYAISLLAVGGSIVRKKNVARLAGYFQIILAAIGFAEVIRRFIFNEDLPDFAMMIGISLLALAANALCLFLLQKSKSEEAHMQASMIFTSNDIIINTGVIIAGVLVYLSQSVYPDLIIGTVVFVLVMRGAFRILKLAK